MAQIPNWRWYDDHIIKFKKLFSLRWGNNHISDIIDKRPYVSDNK